MNPSLKNLGISVVVIVFYVWLARHFADQHSARLGEHEVRQTERASSPLLTSHRKRSSGKLKTVADLFDEFSGKMTAKELAWSLRVSDSQLDRLSAWEIATFHLSQMSQMELSKLRHETIEMVVFQSSKSDLLTLINDELWKRNEGDRRVFFDELITTGYTGYDAAERILNWSREDPVAAQEWFREIDFDTIFEGRPESLQRERAAILDSVLEGLAYADLAGVVDFVLEERDALVGSQVPTKLVSRLIESAVSTQDDALLVRYLNAFQSSYLPAYSERSTYDPFWTSFTRATGDVDRSVRLLDSLPERAGYELALAQVIDGNEGLTFQGKSGWLKERLREEDGYHRGMSELMEQLSFNGDFDSPNPQLVEWLEQQAATPATDRLLINLIQKFDHQFNFPSYFAMAQKLTNPEVRETMTRDLAISWLDDSPERARENLPPSLLEEIR